MQLHNNSIDNTTLILKSNKIIWDLLDVVNVKNYSEEINGIYLVHEISGNGIADNLLKRIGEHSKDLEKNFDYVYAFTTKSNLISQTFRKN